jgi:hypothetical protein
VERVIPQYSLTSFLASLGGGSAIGGGEGREVYWVRCISKMCLFTKTNSHSSVISTVVEKSLPQGNGRAVDGKYINLTTIKGCSKITVTAVFFICRFKII